jgi:uncharacterized protein (UPF0210 family)
MNIRSVTVFCNPEVPLNEETLEQAGRLVAAARPAFEAAGYPVQTARLASLPFPRLVAGWSAPDIDWLAEWAQTLSQQAASLGLDYVSLGPALPEIPESYAAIPALLSAAENLFLGGSMTDTQGRISLPAVRLCAGVIHQAASITPDGFTNLRFAALANVPPGSPFFPAAYHAGGEPAFALATEAADLAVSAFEAATSLDAARLYLVEAMQEHAAALAEIAGRLAAEQGFRFGGIDFSLAPFPEERRSLGASLERLGVPAAGLHGSLAAAAFLADAMDRAQFMRAGFSGLMLPVLEDATLAQRAGEGLLSVKDLLLYSAVCGTGLDTLPLPGDLTAQEIMPLLLDLAALACRLNKPLTARLMPIPGKKAGDPTGFDFAYFANSRVLPLEARPLRGLLAGEEAFALSPRPARR